MSKFVMLGMDEEHAKFLYDLAKKEIDTIDTVLEKKCYENIVGDMTEFLESRRKIASESLELLAWVF